VNLGVWVLGFGAQGFGFMVQGVWFLVYDFWFRGRKFKSRVYVEFQSVGVQGLGDKVQSFRLQVSGSGFRIGIGASRLQS